MNKDKWDKGEYREVGWTRWMKRHKQWCIEPLKLLVNEKEQYEKISDKRILDGVKILKKEQMLLKDCIDQFLLKEKNEYIWKPNVKELEEMRDECDYYDVNRANCFGINMKTVLGHDIINTTTTIS